MQVFLEITPENAKLRLDQIDTRRSSSKTGLEHRQEWKEIYSTLFQELGFDDKLSEPDHTGLFPNQTFSSEQLAENKLFKLQFITEC